MDSLATSEILSFLDAYSGYHRINLATDDQEKTSYITPFGIFFYTKMDFGLKNVGGGGYVSEVRAHHLGKPDWEERRNLH
jgi:hypothetical protein